MLGAVRGVLGWQGSVGTQGPEGVEVAFWDPMGCWGPLGGIRGVLEAGWECRYLGARRGIAGIRAFGLLRGVRGVWAIRGH